MSCHNIGDMLFSRKYGLGTIVAVEEYFPFKSSEEKGMIDYVVEWEGGAYSGKSYAAYPYTQKLDALQVRAYKNRLVEVLERYTTGSVREICRMEGERTKREAGL